MKFWDKLREILKSLGIEIPEDKIEDVKKQLNDLQIGEDIQIDKMGVAELKQQLLATNEVLKTVNKNFEEEVKVREQISNELKANVAKQQSTKIKDLLDKAVKSGAITPEEAKFSEDAAAKGKYQTRLEKDFDDWSADLSSKITSAEQGKKTDAQKEVKTDDKKDTATEPLRGFVSEKMLEYVKSSSK